MSQQGNSIPLVSICTTTYNHERYIAQCLDGLLMQKTSFNFEILVHEDASTDNTANILRAYEERYPEIIRCVYQTENQFLKQNTLINLLFPMVRGKYVALCEGDDFWTDPLKLQKQVDFLEGNPDYMGCCSNVQEKQGDAIRDIHARGTIITFDDLLKGNCIYTCTILYRHPFTVPAWFDECKMGDWVIWLMLAKNGLIYNFPDLMAVYRLHANGMWIGMGKENNLKNIIKAYNVFIREFDKKYIEKLKAGAKQYYDQLLDLLSSNGSKETFEWTMKAFREYRDIKQFRYILRYWRNKILPSRPSLSNSHQSSALP